MRNIRDCQLSMFLKVARRHLVMPGAQGPSAAGGQDNAPLGLVDFFEKAGIKEFNGRQNQIVTSLVWDSRQVVAGSLFFAIQGDNVDGNNFVEEAIEKGAIAIISNKNLPVSKNVACVVVDNVRIVLAKCAQAFYDYPSQDLTLVGITGTNGKTTVSRLTKYLLDQGNNACGLIGTIEYMVKERSFPSHKTTPEADEISALLAEMRMEACHSAVMEVSSHGVDQSRVYGLSFNTLAFLNLTRDHLDYHGTMDDYYKTKASLFLGESNPLPENAVVNIDEEYGRKLLRDIPSSINTITYSYKTNADFSANEINVTESGTSFVLNSPEGRFKVVSPFLGKFNVGNLLASIACAYASGCKVESLVEMISDAPSVPGRLELIDESQNFLAIVDYAHTDDALDNILHTVRSLIDGRLIVVFGCGGDRDRTKRPMMMSIACRYSDFVVATSDNPRTEKQSHIFDDMLGGMDGHTRVNFINDREDAIKTAVQYAEKGDAVVVAGKGHEAFQILDDSVIPFDDRSVLRSAIRETLTNKTDNFEVK